MSRLLERLRRKEFTVTVEIDPPRGPDDAEALERVRSFAAGVDGINVADGPLASVRMSAIVLAHRVQRACGVECIVHLTARDRNLIALQSELLGAAALGVGAVLCLTGDRPEAGEERDAVGVFQLDAAGLVRLVAGLNEGRTASGRELNGATRFAIAVAANPTADDLEREVDKLLAKVDAGAHFVQTQPVFRPEAVWRFQEALARRGLDDLPVLYGVMPFRSLKSAQYVARNVPGISVPDAVLARMEQGGPDEGVRIATELIAALHGHVHGVHLFPMNATHLVSGVLAGLAELGLRPALAAPRRAAAGAEG